jgi:comEA protein
MLDLTPSERRFIFILTITLVMAGVVQLFGPFSTKEQLPDYSESDSIFSRLSHQPVAYDASQSHEENIATSKISETKKSDIKQEFININTADIKEFEKLPRIGPAIASRIVAYRDQHGSFKSIDDLKKVKGIGAKTLENIKPYLQQLP